MAAERMVILGRLRAPWGIKGSVKVESYTDPPAALLDYPVWYVATSDGGWEEIRIKAGRPHGGRSLLVVDIAGVDSPEAARRFTERDVAEPRSALPATAPGEYYWEDLRGCRVTTLEGRELGEVAHFLEFPANPVMVVRGADKQEHWLPLVPGLLKDVNLEARSFRVDWAPVE